MLGLAVYLLPLPHPDRGPQVLAGILRIRCPIVVGELDAAAVCEAAERQIERERNLPQFIRLERFGFRENFVEQSPERGKTHGSMSRGRALHLGFVALGIFVEGRSHLRLESFGIYFRQKVGVENAVDHAANGILQIGVRVASTEANESADVKIQLLSLALEQDRVV